MNARNQKHEQRNIEVFAEATNIEGWRKQAIAGQKDTRQFAIIADEGPYMPGGEGTAPTPQTYFVAGIALCTLSQISNIAMRKKLKIRNERVLVTAHFLESGSILAGDKNGAAKNFEIMLEMDSDEDDDVIADLMRFAHQMCFAEDSLSKAAPISFAHSHNGKAIKLNTDK